MGIDEWSTANRAGELLASGVLGAAANFRAGTAQGHLPAYGG